MDPDTTLIEIEHLVQVAQVKDRMEDEYDPALAGTVYAADAEQTDWKTLATTLAEKIEALDDWLSSEGFLPSDWAPREQR